MGNAGVRGVTDQNEGKKQNMDPFYNVQIGNVEFFKDVSLEILLNSRDENDDSLFSKAVMCNDLNCAKLIYERCPSLLYCETSKHGWNALHHAAAREKLEILKFLINADIESRERGAKRELTRMLDNESRTALFIAVLNNKIEAVKLLNAADPDFQHPPNNLGQTPLMCCKSDYSKQEMFKLLLEIAPIQSKDKRNAGVRGVTDQNEVKKQNMDPFYNVQIGNVEFFKDVSLEILINSRDENDDSLFSKAVMCNDLNCAKLIYERCPSLLYCETYKHGWNALHHAAAREKLEILKFLTNADIESRGREAKRKLTRMLDNESRTALFIAVLNNKIEAVKLLNAADPDFQHPPNNSGRTPLMCCKSDSSKQEMFKLLLEIAPIQSKDKRNAGVRGVTDQNEAKKQNMDPFYNVQIGNVEFFKDVSLEILINSRDENDDSLFSKAVMCNDLNCAKLIYERCPSLLYCETYKHGWNALHHAAAREKLEILKFLINADIESRGREAKRKLTRMLDNESRTALFIAVLNNKIEAVKLLNAADPDFQHPPNTSDRTPLMCCKSDSSKQEMFKLLLEIAPIQTGNISDTAGTDPDFEYGANTDGNMSLSIATTQAEEALYTGNNSDSAGKDAINDFEKVHHTSLATDRMEDFYVGEFDKNSSTDSTTRLLYNLANEKPRPYSHAQLMKFTKEFSDPVGSGGFGDVYKGEFPNGVLIAVKVLKNSMSELMKKQFEAEVSTMGRTYHRNLIKLYGHCYEVDKKALIYEYMEEGDLDVILKKKYLDMVKVYTIATEIARGISYLHEHCNPPIVHHDLKPANVLLDSKFSPRVIDFGLATFNLEKSKFTHFGRRGSHGYIAPEITLPGLGRINSKCDVYSFGMMLFDILKSQINYEDQRWLPGQVWEKFKENKLDNFLKEHGIKEDDEANAKTLSMVALSCSEYYPQKRPSMSSQMFEGEMTPCPSADPFPYYDSSSDCNSINE